MTPSRGRLGVTLIELCVALAVLGVVAAVVGLGLSNAQQPVGGLEDRIAAVRRQAVHSGRVVVDSVLTDGGVVFLAARPDGSVLTDPPILLDPFAGGPR